MPKILLATYEYPPDLGGVAAYLGGLFGAMPDVRVVRFRLPKLPLLWLLHLPKLRRAARAADVVVVSHLLPLGAAAMLVGKPYAVIVHGLDLRNAAARPRKRALASRVLKGAKLVVANSRATAADLAPFGVEPSSALVLTPAVDDVLAAGSATPQPHEGLSVLAVGRLVPRKGFDRLIAMLPELRQACGDVRLTIAGDGPEEGRLRGLAEATGVRAFVRFAIAPDRAALASLYRSADVFALAARHSKDDVEGFGIVFLEAALYGLPVAAVRTGGVPEAVLDGETGLLAEPESDAAFLANLKRLLTDRALARSLGEAGRARVLKGFRWEDRSRALLARLA
jgi:phosphatidylinositol alpha-1,6-mannosyltransferase